MINLYINWFEDKVPVRQAELETCVSKNLENNLIDRIFELAERPTQHHVHPKIHPVVTHFRPTYKMFFELVNIYSGADDINIISNTDIYFDKTLEHVNKIQPNQSYILTRWELLQNGGLKHLGMCDSQDVWIFRGKLKNIYGDFHMGKRGCDNRIAHEIKVAGYETINPSLTIKAIHYHQSNVRNYVLHGDIDLIPPPWHFVGGTHLT